MLVLSRRKDETIMIGDDIQITVLSVDRGVVRIGVAAPGEVPVHRREVYDEIKQRGRRAAGVLTDRLPR